MNDLKYMENKTFQIRARILQMTSNEADVVGSS